MESDKRHERSWNDPPMFSMEQLNKASSSVPLGKRYRYPQQQAVVNQPTMYQQGATTALSYGGYGGGQASQFTPQPSAQTYPSQPYPNYPVPSYDVQPTGNFVNASQSPPPLQYTPPGPIAPGSNYLPAGNFATGSVQPGYGQPLPPPPPPTANAFNATSQYAAQGYGNYSPPPYNSQQ